MMMNIEILVIFFLLLIIVGVLFYTNKERFIPLSVPKTSITEGYKYMNTGQDIYPDQNEVGIQDINYDVVENYTPYIDPYPQPDDYIPYVPGGYEEPRMNAFDSRYFEVEKSYHLPNDTYFAHAIKPPNVILKERNRDYSMSTFIRGDIPITFFDIPVINKSKYGIGSQNFDGLFAQKSWLHKNGNNDEVWIN